MLALVKKPLIELSIQGERIDELLDWIMKKYDVTILAQDVEDSVSVEKTEFWKEMEKNRVGNLLAGARLKSDLTQAALAKAMGIKQSMISDYERGKRKLSPSMAKRMSKVLKVKVERLISP